MKQNNYIQTYFNLRSSQMYTSIITKQYYLHIIQCGYPQDDGGMNTLQRVKFLILKNLASIAKEKDEMSTAIAAYIEVMNKNRNETGWNENGEYYVYDAVTRIGMRLDGMRMENSMCMMQQQEQE